MKRFLLLYVSLFAGAALRAQPGPSFDDAGRFPSESFMPRDYGAHAQNWSVVQDARGVMYFANSDGVLVYDGHRWSPVLPLSNKSLVRSLALGPDGRIYAGGEGDFGYLVPDSAGSLQFVSLVEHVPPEYREFGPVWKAMSTSEGVYFLTYDHLFRWSSDGSLNTWTRPFTGNAGFVIRDTLYVYEHRRGLLQMRGDSLHLLPGTEVFAETGLYVMLPYDDGRFLLGNDTRLVLYDGRHVTPFETDVDDVFAKSWIYAGATLPGDFFVIGTIRDGAFVLDRDGRLVRRLTKERGLPSNTVLSAFRDREGSLWLGLDGGITRIEALSSLSLFDETLGLEGNPSAVARYRGSLYVATNHGLFALRHHKGGAVMQPVPGTAAQCWSLLPTPAGLLLGASSGLHRIVDGRAHHVPGAGSHVYTLVRSHRDTTTAYAGTQRGLVLLRLRKHGWELQTRIRGITQAVRSIVEDRDGTLWLGTDYEGILHVHLSPDHSEAVQVTHFGTEDGLPDGAVEVFAVDDRVLVASRREVHPLMIASQSGLLPDSSALAAAFGYAPRRYQLLHEDDAGNIWMSVDDTLGLAKHLSDGSYRWEPLSARDLFTRPTSYLLSEPDGIVWIAQQGRLVRFDTTPSSHNEAFQTLIRRVSVVGTDSLIYGGYAVETPPRALLPYEANAVRFDFAAPSYKGEATPRFQYLLEGFDRKWSVWTEDTRKEYTNLPAGDYTFRVRAQDAYGRNGREATFVFRIRPPWYQTGWAVGLFAFSGLLGLSIAVYGLIRWRSARLSARNRALEREVVARTAEIDAQRRRLNVLNEELSRTVEELKKANEMKSELLGVAAHDLKNPLTSILGFARILREEHPPDHPAREPVDLIYGAAEHMYQLIRDLLDSVAAESGRITLNKRPVDLAAVAERVLLSHMLQARQKHQKLLFEAGSTAPTLVEGDEDRLREAMGNLISNAIKYAPRHSTIRVSVYTEEGEVRFAVRDEGPGLSEDEQSKLFQPFQRLSPRPTGNESSTGLGLYIVKQYMALHGGRVWAESKLGSGSTFTLALPATPAPHTTDEHTTRDGPTHDLGFSRFSDAAADMVDSK